MRRLSPDEQALWRRVVESVRPLDGRVPPPAAEPAPAAAAAPVPPPAPAAPKPVQTKRGPSLTLDGSWDKRVDRGHVQPDATLDLHGHNLATAHALLDRRLDQAIAEGHRVLLLITGKPPSSDRRPVARGAIRAAVGDWLAASRHAGDIAAVRNAHPRHGGQGALYIILRRSKA